MLGQLPNYWWALILLGVFAGTTSGALGIGSGVVIVPALALLPFFALEQKAAQGTALALMVPMALLGAFRYWKNPEIEISPAVIVFVVMGALPGVLVGTELAARLPNHVLRKIFAVVLAITALKMFAASQKPHQPGSTENPAGQNNVSAVETGDNNSEPTAQYTNGALKTTDRRQ